MEGLTRKLRTAAIAMTCCVTVLQLVPHALAAETAKPPAKPNPITGTTADPDWKENYAYTLGVQAYLFSFPWYYATLQRCDQVTKKPPAGMFRQYAGVGELYNFRHLVDASWTQGGAPNNDTLYSSAWLDVGKEPVIISIPDMGDRYWTVQMMAYNGDNFGYIGTRTTGNAAGNYAIVGPNWKGQLPAGVKAVAPSPTPWVFPVIRTYISGSAELDTVHKIQDQYKLTPLSQWGKPTVKAAANRDVWCPYPREGDPLADWKTINRSLTENPPQPQHKVLVDMFEEIGVGPGQDVDKVDPATQRGLLRALDEGKRLLVGAAAAVAGASFRNGWMIPPPSTGHGGVNNDILLRGVTNLLGFATNDPEEAMYPAAVADSTGQQLNGSNNYVIHFSKEQIPPVKAFWSLTMYGVDNNLVANPINRYSIGDRTPGIQYADDGSLTLYIQGESPGEDKASNWLPSPKDGRFLMYMRMYLPEQRALDGEWAPPALVRQ